jgi:hypothetical protein
MSSRDQSRELAFLAAAGRGHEPFVTQVRARLEEGEPEFGDSWCWIGIRRHLAELLEEAADLGAWSALADQALDLDRELADVDRQRIHAVLTLAARHGAQAHEHLAAALRSIGATTA